MKILRIRNKDRRCFCGHIIRRAALLMLGLAVAAAFRAGNMPAQAEKWRVSPYARVIWIGVDGVGSPILLLDASGLSQDDIHWFALYVSLVGELDTTAHSKEELALLSSRYLYEGEIRLSLAEKAGTDEFRPNLRASWTAADEDLQAGYDLIHRVIAGAARY